MLVLFIFMQQLCHSVTFFSAFGLTIACFFVTVITLVFISLLFNLSSFFRLQCGCILNTQLSVSHRATCSFAIIKKKIPRRHFPFEKIILCHTGSALEGGYCSATTIIYFSYINCVIELYHWNHLGIVSACEVMIMCRQMGLSCGCPGKKSDLGCSGSLFSVTAYMKVRSHLITW